MFKRFMNSCAERSEITVLLPLPSHYKYALVSEASYYDDAHFLKYPRELESPTSLTDKRFEHIAADFGYNYSLWFNHENKQVIITHHGSRNLDYWVTDAEIVTQLKLGSSVKQLSRLLTYPLVKYFKTEGCCLLVSVYGAYTRTIWKMSGKRDQENTLDNRLLRRYATPLKCQRDITIN